MRAGYNNKQNVIKTTKAHGKGINKSPLTSDRRFGKNRGSDGWNSRPSGCAASRKQSLSPRECQRVV